MAEWLNYLIKSKGKIEHQKRDDLGRKVSLALKKAPARQRLFDIKSQFTDAI